MKNRILVTPWIVVALVCGLSPSCGTSAPSPIRLVIQAKAFGEDLACAGEVSTPMGALEISNLRFFLSHPRVRLGDHASLPIHLETTAAQQRDVALVTVRQKGSDCLEDHPKLELFGTIPQSSRLLSSFEESSLPEVTFLLGVPKEANHANPVLAEPPLTIGAMHWTWLSGYKFLRFEGQLEDSTLLFHLGSTGCSGPPQKAQCQHANLLRIATEARLVHRADGPELHVEWDISELLIELVQAGNHGGDGRCQSTPDDRDCQRLLPGGPEAPPSLLETSFQASATVGPSGVFPGAAR